MPIYDYLFPPDALEGSRQKLQNLGPIIEVEISIPDSLAALFQLLNQPIPQPVKGFGVLDTGAYTTAVNKSILRGFGGSPIGTRQVDTAGARAILDVFPAKITFPGTTITRGLEEAIAMEDMTISYNGVPIIALIGREVLADCVLIYNGKTGIYTLTH